MEEQHHTVPSEARIRPSVGSGNRAQAFDVGALPSELREGSPGSGRQPELLSGASGELIRSTSAEHLMIGSTGTNAPCGA